MKDRTEFTQRLHDEIDEMDARLERLRLKAKLGGMEAQESFEKLDQTMKEKTRPIRAKLKELSLESGDAWQDIAKGCERSWGEAKTAITSAIKRFTD